MASHHLADTTTLGAPDEIIDFFAILVNWLTATVGWTVAATASNVDYTFQSLGEAGGYTMLFVHVWRVGVGNTIRMEVCDDIIPTHQTAELGTLDTAGANPVQFWMSANLEQMILCIANGAGCRYISAGALMPFAQNPVDETYHMVATSGQLTASILRASTGVWDVDIGNFGDPMSDNYLVDNLTATYPLFGMFADQGNLVAGQYHLQSYEINGMLAHGATLDTIDAGGTSTWIVLHDNVSGHRFALWTGGVIPTGSPDGAWFGSAAAAAATAAALLNALDVFALARGWTVHGDPGFPLVPPRLNRQYHSVGEDGTRDIWVYLCYDTVTNIWWQYVSDDAILTNFGNHGVNWQVGWWPCNYIFAGDRDCLVVCVQEGTNNTYWALYIGIPNEAAPWTDPYSNALVARVANLGGANGVILQQHSVPPGWAANLAVWERNLQLVNSNASAFDGQTYFVAPITVSENLMFIGTLKYLYYTDGGGIAQGDTITVGAQVYTVLAWSNIPYYFALRTT